MEKDSCLLKVRPLVGSIGLTFVWAFPGLIEATFFKDKITVRTNQTIETIVRFLIWSLPPLIGIAYIFNSSSLQEILLKGAFVAIYTPIIWFFAPKYFLKKYTISYKEITEFRPKKFYENFVLGQGLYISTLNQTFVFGMDPNPVLTIIKPRVSLT